MKFKIGEKVKIKNKPSDYRLSAYAGKVGTISGLPKLDHSFLYRVEFDDFNEKWLENEWEYVSEDDLVKGESKR